MKMRWSLALMLAGLCGLLLQSQSGAGDTKEKPKKEKAGKDLTVNGELTVNDTKDKVRTECHCKTYTFKMIKGHTYQLDMMSEDFDAYLRLE